MDDGFSTYLFEYQFDGGKWLMEVPARSPEEAEERLQRVANHGSYLGRGVMKVPAAVGPWVPFWCRLRNWLLR